MKIVTKEVKFTT